MSPYLWWVLRVHMDPWPPSQPPLELLIETDSGERSIRLPFWSFKVVRGVLPAVSQSLLEGVASVELSPTLYCYARDTQHYPKEYEDAV